MASFSQRLGLKPLQKALQLDSVDQELRNDLWTFLSIHFLDQHKAYVPAYDTNQRLLNEEVENAVAALYVRLWRKPMDSIPTFRGESYERAGIRELRDCILQGEWNHVYDALDFLVRVAPKRIQSGLVDALNECLEHDNAGYRFVGDQLVSITESAEIAAIEEALASPSDVAKAHFNRALEFLSDRQKPDYRNSIKESISAVEGVAQSIAGKRGATLNDCLKVIKTVKPIHAAFEQALIKLYAWTSDDGGIRHAIHESKDVITYADAKFMLVTCSAFTSYLWTVAAETNIAPK